MVIENPKREDFSEYTAADRLRVGHDALAVAFPRMKIHAVVRGSFTLDRRRKALYRLLLIGLGGNFDFAVHALLECLFARRRVSRIEEFTHFMRFADISL